MSRALMIALAALAGLTLAAPGAYANVDTFAANAYVDARGDPLTGLTCGVTDQGLGITDAVLACHSERGGWQCYRSLTSSPQKYVCQPWLDKKTGKQTDDPFADMPDPAPEERATTLAECNNKPTTVGVLFCRWGVK
jgi:hypothetical protein